MIAQTCAPSHLHGAPPQVTDAYHAFPKELRHAKLSGIMVLVNRCVDVWGLCQRDFDGSPFKARRSNSRALRSSSSRSLGGVWSASSNSRFRATPLSVRTTSLTRLSPGMDLRSASSMRSSLSTIQVAFEASHCHASASERMVQPSWKSRLNSARESLGVSPRSPRSWLRSEEVSIR
jgi:hypothetical protein